MNQEQLRTITVLQGKEKEVFRAVSLNDTRKCVEKIVHRLKGGDVLALSGNLGAGKTTFVQMLGEELGTSAQITSPTFVLMKLYPLKKGLPMQTLCHIDAYRLSSSRDLEAIGAGDFIGDPTVVTCIEWPERVAGIIPVDAIKISIVLQ